MSISFPPPISALRETIQNRLGAAWQHYHADLDILLHLQWLGFQPTTIYDIGASNTVWSVMAHAVFPKARLELFEPLAEISDAYLHGKRTHPAVRQFLEQANFQIHPIALGTQNGECLFYHYEGDAGSTSLDLEHVSPSAQQVKVPMQRLDDYVKSKMIALPDLVKMDTQGAELEILEGGRKTIRHASAIFAECWLTKGYGKKTPLLLPLANALSDLEFDLFGLGDEYRSPEGNPQTKDAVFIKRTLSLHPDPVQ